MWDRHIGKGGTHRQKMSTQVFASQHKTAKEKDLGEGVILVEDPIEFKRTSNLFPLPKEVDVSKLSLDALMVGAVASEEGEITATG